MPKYHHLWLVGNNFEIISPACRNQIPQFILHRPPHINSHLPLGGSSKDIWDFIFYRSDGRVHIIGEWVSRTKAHRYIVIGPDWACVAMTYIVIITPSVFVAIYLLVNLAEKIIYFILFGLCIFGLTTVFIADPGLVRKYHHARSRHWTYWYTNTMP